MRELLSSRVRSPTCWCSSSVSQKRLRRLRSRRRRDAGVGKEPPEFGMDPPGQEQLQLPTSPPIRKGPPLPQERPRGVSDELFRGKKAHHHAAEGYPDFLMVLSCIIIYRHNIWQEYSRSGTPTMHRKADYPQFHMVSIGHVELE